MHLREGTSRNAFTGYQKPRQPGLLLRYQPQRGCKKSHNKRGYGLYYTCVFGNKNPEPRQGPQKTGALKKKAQHSYC